MATLKFRLVCNYDNQTLPVAKINVQLATACKIQEWLRYCQASLSILGASHFLQDLVMEAISNHSTLYKKNFFQKAGVTLLFARPQGHIFLLLLDSKHSKGSNMNFCSYPTPITDSTDKLLQVRTPSGNCHKDLPNLGARTPECLDY